MNETIFDRISTIVEKFGNGKNTVFASLIGVSEANVRNYKNGVMPKADFLEKIARSFDININWLLTGEGNMLSSESEKEEKLPSVNQTYEGTPYFNVDFSEVLI